ncbi:MAG: hypothetical protein Q8R24_08200 [Legionellaceae bacterium]|nr:hypothetical protein [Legionellaceae bacterium]
MAHARVDVLGQWQGSVSGHERTHRVHEHDRPQGNHIDVVGPNRSPGNYIDVHRNSQAPSIVVYPGTPSWAYDQPSYQPTLVLNRPRYPWGYNRPHFSCFGASLAGIFLVGASVAFLALFVLPVVAKVLLALVIILGVVAVTSTVFNAARRSTFFGGGDTDRVVVDHSIANGY